jgi:hypothetical protein
MMSTNNGLYSFLGGKGKQTLVTVAAVLVTYAQAAETGRALIETTGVQAQTVEAKFDGDSTEADSGWDF